jgi:bcr-type benzoyl-CoA reductase subunit B
MSLLSQMRYHANVTVAGNAYLKLDRLRLARKLARPWEHDHLGPPLQTSPRLKELISKHYLKGRFANDRYPVAWITSGAPVEVLQALGYFIIYPENHAAVCGIRRQGEEMARYAEDAGYSPDLCSYARADIGAALSGKTPVGRLPKPDLLLCCTNICQTVLYWYRVLAEHFGCPLVVIDTPFVYDQASDHSKAYVQRQLEEAIPVCEQVAGKRLDWARLRKVTELSREAVALWGQVLQCGQARPAPITAFDEFIHMAPIVEMRGEQFTVDYYRALLAELRGRIANGVGAVKEERYRVIWDNLPIWHRLRWLGELLAEQHVAMVASTYTNAWGELADLIDPDRPMESAAECYIHPILNRGTGHKLQVMRDMVTAYQADGVILHSDRSCKPYSIGQVDQRNKLANDMGVPALLLEADHNDPRAFSEEQSATRLAAFLEMMAA